jgi:hypothetical protein
VERRRRPADRDAQAILSTVVFMHLPWTRRMTRVVAVIGLLWLGIVIVDAMDDPLTRGSLLMTGE